MTKKVNCYIGLGSNLGNRSSNIRQAIVLLSKHIGLLTAKSFTYESEPWGEYDGVSYPYLNAAVLITTQLSVHETLAQLQSIELKLGRKRSTVNAPRIIDLDILYYGQQIVKKKDLIVPHPYLADRRFVLKPLQDIDPGFLHPSLGLPTRELLQKCSDPQQVLTCV